MRTILKEDFLAVPAEIKSIKVKARKVTVEGPKGTVTKDFSHIALDIKVLNMATAKQKGKTVRIQMWNGGYKQACAVTTIKSLINNMFIGVTEGFRYKMRLVHAHFPINVVISKDKKQIEVKNFLGGKKAHLIVLQPGTTVYLSKDVKDELVFDGICNAAVSLSCA
jgi:large subunit ribosomal protein L9e